MLFRPSEITEIAHTLSRARQLTPPNTSWAFAKGFAPHASPAAIATRLRHHWVPRKATSSTRRRQYLRTEVRWQGFSEKAYPLLVTPAVSTPAAYCHSGAMQLELLYLPYNDSKAAAAPRSACFRSHSVMKQSQRVQLPASAPGAVATPLADARSPTRQPTLATFS